LKKKNESEILLVLYSAMQGFGFFVVDRVFCVDIFRCAEKFPVEATGRRNSLLLYDSLVLQ
jgi:hypothetical protein